MTSLSLNDQRLILRPPPPNPIPASPIRIGVGGVTRRMTTVVDGPEDESLVTPKVWKVSQPINYSEQLQVSGGIAAPLFAGFCLTTIAQLVIGSDHPWLYEWAVAALAASASLFIYTLQLSALAVGLSASPSERLDYYPDARSNVETLKRIRERQWKDAARRKDLTGRAGFCYDVGLLAFLGGLALIIVPRVWNPWPIGRTIALAVIGLAMLIELIWFLTKAKYPKRLLATDITATPEAIVDEGTSQLFPPSPPAQ
jgi:hypothetical protein